MKKEEAIEFLVKYSVYGNEWQGAGMWEAVKKVMETPNKRITLEFLKLLLKKAEDF